jgi:bile acid-coenzyme A ligase
MSDMSDAPEPIGQALGRLARENPDLPAITMAGSSVTRDQLERRSNRLARAFGAAGVGAEDLVTIALPNSVEFLEAAVACWKLGAVPQPVSARLPGRELATIVELADSALVVGVDADLVPGRVTWAAGREPDAGLSDEPLPPAAAGSWKAPTSGGSTGRPKLILSGDPAMVPAGPGLNMRRDGCMVIPGPLYHNAPFTSSSLGLFYGNHVVLLPRFDAEATLRAVDEHRPDFMLVVPTMMIRILRLDERVRARYDVSSLQTVWHMGAPCPAWAKRAWIDWLGGEKIWELYAGTEMQAVTVIRGDDWLQHVGSVGRVIGGEMKIVDPETGQDLPAGEVGEIFLRVSPGGKSTYRYLGAEAQTIGDGWESLGDMGSFDEEGYLYLADRRADMILSGGANIYPAEVEAALNEHRAVESCAVIGLPDQDLGQVVHAICRVSPGTAPPSDEELAAFVAERLVRYKVPRGFEWVDEPVRDDAGKVRRSALRSERVSPPDGEAQARRRVEQETQ